MPQAKRSNGLRSERCCLAGCPCSRCSLRCAFRMILEELLPHRIAAAKDKCVIRRPERRRLMMGQGLTHVVRLAAIRLLHVLGPGSTSCCSLPLQVRF